MAFLFQEQVEFFRTNGYLIFYQRIIPGMIRKLLGTWKNLMAGRNRGISGSLPGKSIGTAEVSELQNLWKTKPGFAMMSPY